MRRQIVTTLYKVNDIFYSLEGEGKWCGFPTIFIRMAQCNLNCSYCFGIRPGRHIPRIILSDKPNKKIQDVEIGDKLLTYDTNKNPVETEVTNFQYREVDEWYRIKINNILYHVTGEHPFFTSRGTVIASELISGDMILHSKSNEKLSFRMRGEKNCIFAKGAMEKHLQTTDYVENGRNRSKLISKQKAKADMRKRIANGLEVQSIKFVKRSEFSPSIRPEPLKVYTISCEPYHSYLVDYMWVHNCDENFDDYTRMPAKEIIDKIKQYPSKRVRITGGEPMMQDLSELMKELYFRYTHVAIETNGTFYDNDVFESAGLISCDIKTPCSGEESDYKIIQKLHHRFRDKTEFKFVISNLVDLVFYKEYRKLIKGANTVLMCDSRINHKAKMKIIDAILRSCPEARYCIRLQHELGLK